MKMTVTTCWPNGCFFVREAGQGRALIWGERYQVIQPEILETLRAGKGYDGLQTECNRLLDQKAEEHAALLRAQGHEVSVEHLT